MRLACADARILVPQWGQTGENLRLQAPYAADPLLAGHMEFFEGEDTFVRALDDAVTADAPPVDHAARAAVFGNFFTYDPNEMATVPRRAIYRGILSRGSSRHI